MALARDHEGKPLWERELLGRCSLPEGTHATPTATQDGVIFRTYRRLICVGAVSEQE